MQKHSCCLRCFVQGQLWGHRDAQGVEWQQSRRRMRFGICPVPKACHTGFVAVPGAGIQILLAHGASATVPAMTGHLPFLFTIHGGTGGMAVLKDS